MKAKVLIIDDDEKLTRLLIRYLGDFGFRVVSAHTPSQGFKKISSFAPDIIILDVMLPEMDGFEICRIIRQTSMVPIIMLTARGDLTDKVVGLEIGSDDYLSKPFEPRELVARINTVLRRSRTAVSNIDIFGSLTVDYEQRKVLVDDIQIELTTGEFTVLALLCRTPGKVFDRDEILQELRGIDCEAFNRTVDIAVSRLRQKINDDPKRPHYIKTVWGAGYVFIGKRNENA